MNLVDQHHHDVGIAPARDVGKAKSYQLPGTLRASVTAARSRSTGNQRRQDHRKPVGAPCSTASAGRQESRTSS